MLEKERFLAIKKLANKIRHDNEELFERFEKESVEDAISEKEEFIDWLEEFSEMFIRFSICIQDFQLLITKYVNLSHGNIF